LSWKTKQSGIEARFIELAGYINGNMPHFVVGKVQSALNNHGKAVKGSRVHIVGVAYKRNIDDMRESPALDVILLLKKLGAEVSYSDPYVPALKLDGIDLKSQEAEASARQADCTVIITDHSDFDYKGLLDSAKLIVDTRNAMRGFESEKIVRL
jgi:UDP-N-acetyl-D-glucosamine dehydrogenase